MQYFCKKNQSIFEYVTFRQLKQKFLLVILKLLYRTTLAPNWLSIFLGAWSKISHRNCSSRAWVSRVWGRALSWNKTNVLFNFPSFCFEYIRSATTTLVLDVMCAWTVWRDLGDLYSAWSFGWCTYWRDWKFTLRLYIII